MPKEFKFIPLSENGVHFKSDEGAGSLEGYAAVFSVLDEGGDIIVPGAFKDNLSEFLAAGFTAQSHDWSVDGVIGYPTKAVEDEYGLNVAMDFHSTADAQAVRTKAQERLKAGKQVGLSIGYKINDSFLIFPKDYAKELPQYVRPDAISETLIKARNFAKIRILKSVETFEWSVVPAPMNREAQAASVKSDTPSVKGMFEDRLTEKTNSFSNLCATLSYVLNNLQYFAQGTSIAFDADALLDEALAEFVARVRDAFMSAVASNDYWDAYYYMGNLDKLTKSLSGKEKAASATLAERSELAASACEEFAQQGIALSEALNTLTEDGKSKHEARTKEGRTISQATANKIEKAATGIDDVIPNLESVRSALNDLLEIAKPKEKASPEAIKLHAQFELMRFKRTQLSA